MRDAEFLHLSRRKISHILSLKSDRAVRGPSEPGQRLDQFGLTVPLDARDTDDLARSNCKRNTVNSLPMSAGDGKVCDFENDVTRLRIGLLNAQQHVAPDDHSRKLSCVRF